MIILIGRSASGKTTIAKKLIEDYNFKKFVTNTTRPMRIGEVNDVDYHFITEEEFLNKKKKSMLIEDTYYNGYHYGTSIEDVSDDKVLIVDINGANKFYEKLKDEVVIFYINASDDVIKQRMIDRKDDLETINSRLKIDHEYFNINKLIHYDYIINTDNDSIDNITLDVLNKYNNKR
ncbi:MAG: AAA family ATPase [Bacilli bacterium]|nr:AAA family ATPase [Bacilli bacterium]